MITSYGIFCFGNTWNFRAVVFLSDISVKFNSISDSLFDGNVPFVVENKVFGRLQIFPKREDYALIQLYRASVSNNNIRSFLVL